MAPHHILNLSRTNREQQDKSQASLPCRITRNYVEAVGGKLHLTAEFPGKPPVATAGFKDAQAKRGRTITEPVS
jgi:hypothetical protein